MDSDIEIIRRTKEELGYDTIVEVSSMKGGFIDKAVYGFPKPFVFTLMEDERYEVERRIFNIGEKVFGLSGRNQDEMIFYQTTSAFGIDYAQISSIGELQINPVKMKYLSDDELAYVLGHEATHLFCKHFRMGDILKDIVKENECYFGKSDDSFFTGLSRYFEFEADRIGVSLAVNAGFNPFGYRTEMGKYSFLFDQDSSGFDMRNTHPSDIDRIRYLDGKNFVKRDFDFDYFRKRLSDMEQILKSNDKNEKIMLEAFYYGKIKDVFYRTKNGLSEQFGLMKRILDKVRLFQYERALRKSSQTVQKVSESGPNHRKMMQDEVAECHEIINDTKKFVDEKLCVKDRAKVLGRNIKNRMREVNEWMR